LDSEANKQVSGFDLTETGRPEIKLSPGQPLLYEDLFPTSSTSSASHVVSIDWVSDSTAGGIGKWADVIAISRSSARLPLGLFQNTITLDISLNPKLELDELTQVNDYVPLEIVIPGVISPDNMRALTQVIAAKYDIAPVSDLNLSFYLLTLEPQPEASPSVTATSQVTSTVTASTSLGPLYVKSNDTRWQELRDCKVIKSMGDLSDKPAPQVNFLTKSKLALFLDQPVQVCHDIVLVSATLDIFQRDDILEEISILESQGWCAIRANPYQQKLIRELANLWPIQLGRATDKHILVKFTRVDVDVGMSLEHWIKQAIQDMQGGDLIKVVYYVPQDSGYTDSHAQQVYRTLDEELREAIIQPIVVSQSVAVSQSVSPEIRLLQFADYNDFVTWQKHLYTDTLPEDKSSEKFPDLPGNVKLYDDTSSPTLEVELPDRYLVFDLIPDNKYNSKWWQEGNALSKYARSYWRRTGKLSVLVC